MFPFVKQFVDFWISRKEEESKKKSYNSACIPPGFSNPMEVAKFLESKNLTYIPDKLDSYTSPLGVYSKLSGQSNFSWTEFDCDDYSNLFGYMIKHCNGVYNIKLRNVIDGLIQKSHVVCTFQYTDANQKVWHGLFSTDTYWVCSGSILWSEREFSEQTLVDRYSGLYGSRTYIGVVDSDLCVF